MVKTLIERPTEAASRAAVDADHQERDRKAWNLPRASVRTAPRRRHPDGLDWDSFRDLYYPASRRHNLTAIVEYGAYKKGSSFAGQPPASKAAHLKADSTSAKPLSLQHWEDEGGIPG